MGGRLERHMSVLEGLVIDSISVDEYSVDIVADGREFQLHHQQECCEDAWVEDVNGDPQKLVGAKVVKSVGNDGTTPNGQSGGEGHEWTFFEITTDNGYYITIRFDGDHGDSGHYSAKAQLIENFTDEKWDAREMAIAKAFKDAFLKFWGSVAVENDTYAIVAKDLDWWVNGSGWSGYGLDSAPLNRQYPIVGFPFEIETVWRHLKGNVRGKGISQYVVPKLSTLLGWGLSRGRHNWGGGSVFGSKESIEQSIEDSGWGDKLGMVRVRDMGFEYVLMNYCVEFEFDGEEHTNELRWKTDAQEKAETDIIELLESWYDIGGDVYDQEVSDED